MCFECDNIVDQELDYAFHVAIKREEMKCIRALLKKGANPYKKLNGHSAFEITSLCYPRILTILEGIRFACALYCRNLTFPSCSVD
jgi:hypothetical protein